MEFIITLFDVSSLKTKNRQPLVLLKDTPLPLPPQPPQRKNTNHLWSDVPISFMRRWKNLRAKGKSHLNMVKKKMWASSKRSVFSFSNNIKLLKHLQRSYFMTVTFTKTVIVCTRSTKNQMMPEWKVMFQHIKRERWEKYCVDEMQ